jgi:hypothetical protein
LVTAGSHRKVSDHLVLLSQASPFGAQCLCCGHSQCL